MDERSPNSNGCVEANKENERPEHSESPDIIGVVQVRHCVHIVAHWPV